MTNSALCESGLHFLFIILHLSPGNDEEQLLLMQNEQPWHQIVLTTQIPGLRV